MTDYRMLDDDVFRDALNAAAHDVVKALVDEAFPNPSIGSVLRDIVTGGEFAPAPDLPRDGLEESEEYWHNLFKQFRGWNIGGGTKPISTAFANDVVEPLWDIAADELGNDRLVDVIRTKLAGWESDTASTVDGAAYVFKNVYLPDLSSSLVHLLRIAESMQAIMITHQNIVLAAREGILRIADQTLERLNALSEARSSFDKNLLRDVTTAAISISLGDPANAVTSTLSAVGTIVAGRDWDVIGSGFDEVSASMVIAIETLADAIRAEEGRVIEAVEQVNGYLTGSHHYASLPPDVNRPLPTHHDPPP